MTFPKNPNQRDTPQTADKQKVAPNKQGKTGTQRDQQSPRKTGSK